MCGSDYELLLLYGVTAWIRLAAQATVTLILRNRRIFFYMCFFQGYGAGQ